MSDDPRSDRAAGRDDAEGARRGPGPRRPRSARRRASRDAMRFFTSGYAQDPIAILNDALFDVTYDEMVIVKDIDFYSLCEHHMLPFFGRVHVAYVPERAGGRAVQDPAPGRDVRAPAPGAGAAHDADRRDARGGARAEGRRGRRRGDPPVHDDARRGAAELRRR